MGTTGSVYPFTVLLSLLLHVSPFLSHTHAITKTTGLIYEDL